MNNLLSIDLDKETLQVNNLTWTSFIFAEKSPVSKSCRTNLNSEEIQNDIEQ